MAKISVRPKMMNSRPGSQSLEYVDGPTCEGLQFLGEIEDQTFTVGKIVTNLTLPEAFGGLPPYSYMLEPTLPAGLTFHSNTRIISGNTYKSYRIATGLYLHSH